MHKPLYLAYLLVIFFALITLLPSYLASLPIFAFTIALGFYLSRRASKDAAATLFSIFLISYLLRVVIALILYRLSFERGLSGYFYGGDDFAYGDTALRLAEAWREGVFPYLKEIKRNMSLSSTMGFYQYYLAVLMIISKDSTFLPIAINCSLGALSIVVLYSITKRTFTQKSSFGKYSSLMTTGLFAFWPSLLLWSALNLKEAPTTFFVLLITATAIKFFPTEFDSKKIIKCVLYLPILLLILHRLRGRISFFVILSIVMTYSTVALKTLLIHRGKAVKISLFVIAAVFIFLVAVIRLQSIDNAVEVLSIHRDFRAFGDSVILPSLRLVTFGDLLRFLPTSVIISFFYPLPWHGASMAGLIAFPEMILWYLLFPFFIRGLFLLLKTERISAYFILFFTLMYFLCLGVLDANAGTLFRHRAVILPFAFLFIVAGMQKENIFKED
ncbi:MAG: hypothetical protein A2Z72_05415 [Omnitrophica bacterium RBG_13_46_9]|nr:MAG: hypothetical protein A2Z72_05415 [Omnitrophica bacterium RBG_13_46_9]